jgi:hypothetical protein
MSGYPAVLSQASARLKLHEDCLRRGTSRRLPLALAPTPTACNAGGGDGATGITATGNASTRTGQRYPALIPDDADYTAR